MKALTRYINHINTNLSIKSLFPAPPTIRFFPENIHCACERKLKVLKTQTRTVATLEIGRFYAHETFMFCDRCEITYNSHELRRLVSDGCSFGFDVLVYVGMSSFLRCRNEEEIQAELYNRNIPISTSEIGYLGKKFIIYLAIAHRESRSEIKNCYCHGEVIFFI